MTEGIQACLGCTSHNSPDNLSGARRRPYRLTAAGSCHCSGGKYVLPVNIQAKFSSRKVGI